MKNTPFNFPVLSQNQKFCEISENRFYDFSKVNEKSGIWEKTGKKLGNPETLDFRAFAGFLMLDFGHFPSFPVTIEKK